MDTLDFEVKRDGGRYALRASTFFPSAAAVKTPRIRESKGCWAQKSIIANFDDDVSIGVRSGKLEMTVTKIF